MAGDQRAAVIRTQIVVAMNQGPISSDQLHIQVQDVDRDLHSRAEALVPKADAAITACHRQYQPEVGDAAAPGGAAWNGACRSVLDNEDSYRAGFRNLREKLDGLEETYHAEREKQDRYLQAANRIQ